MPDIFTAALDKIAKGALDSQVHNLTLGANKAGFIAAEDMPAAEAGAKVWIGAVFAMLASGQGGPEG